MSNSPSPVDSAIGTPIGGPLTHDKTKKGALLTELHPDDLVQLDDQLLQSSTSLQPLPARTKNLIDHTLDITPFESPVNPLPKAACISPRDYLPLYDEPFGQDVAEWQRQNLGSGDMSMSLTYRTTPDILPLNDRDITRICLFYPDPDPNNRRRPSEVYLRRVAYHGNSLHPFIIYCPPDFATEVRKIRSDPYWVVIDKYESVWDIPNNQHMTENFRTTQQDRFARFAGDRVENPHWGKYRGGWACEPNPSYNRPHCSAVYNAKAFITYDAVMRNPFGSNRFMYVDAGWYDDKTDWTQISDTMLDMDKIDRALKISRHTGVVMSEYTSVPGLDAFDTPDIEDEAWTDPLHAWRTRSFVACDWIGTRLGMLNFSLRIMQTVEDMDSNGFYVGREEYIIPHVCVRYPNTVFSMPDRYVKPDQSLAPDQASKFSFLRSSGKEECDAVTDPISTLFVPGYKPRHRNLEVGEYCHCESCSTFLF